MSEKPTLANPDLKSGSATGAESPTTARELDWDDEPQDSHLTAKDPTPPTTKSPSPKPRVSFQDEQQPPTARSPKPMGPHAQLEASLVEAFPTLQPQVVRAVLVAVGWDQGRAVDVLMNLVDENWKPEEEMPPPQPPRPHQHRSQAEEDEALALELHWKEVEGARRHAQGTSSRGAPVSQRSRQQTGLKPNELYDDREHSFFDDDLPVIKENIRKGFLETQTKFNSWISQISKKIDGEDDDDELPPPKPPRPGQRQDFGPSQSNQMYGIRKSSEARRSGDRERYDADPHVLSDDFTALELRDEEIPSHTRSNRPLANPDLFKPTPVAPPSGPIDEVDALYRQPTPTNRQPSPNGGSKTKKWQPLTSVAPNPESDDHDPFSLGDSDDEDAKKTDLKPENLDRLKKTASQSVSAGSGQGGLQAAERSGSISQKNKEAEELLKNA